MTNQQISLFYFCKTTKNNPNQLFYIFSLTLTHVQQNFTPLKKKKKTHAVLVGKLFNCLFIYS